MNDNKQKICVGSRKRKGSPCGIQKIHRARINNNNENIGESINTSFTSSKFSTGSEKIPKYLNNSKPDYTFASVLGKHHLATVEEESCLDYEPSEVEIPHRSTSTNTETKYEESNVINDERPKEFNSAELHNNIESQYPCLFSNVLDGSCINKETGASRYDTRNTDIKNDIFMNKDGVSQNHINENKNISKCNGDEHINEEEQKNMFDNAKVDFKGGNIKITRFMKNNYQTGNVDDNMNRSAASNESNLRPLPHDSPNLKIISIDKWVPEEHRNMKNQPFLEMGEHENISQYSIRSSDNRLFQNDNEYCRSDFEPQALQEESFRPSVNQNKKQFTFSSNKRNNRDNNFYGSNNSSGTLFVNNYAQFEDNIKKGHSQNSSEQGSGKICSQRNTGTSPKGNENEKLMLGKEEFINNWLIQSKEDDFSGVLDSLCEPYFNTECTDCRCTKKHSLEYIKNIIKRANLEESEKMYKLTMEREVWFKCLFETFLEHFKLAKTGDIFLMDMINDVYKVFNGTLIDKTSFINKIIKGLQELGLSFNDAIENIILKYGTSQLWISDILLFLITNEPNLGQHWCLVQKITRCRKEKIDNEVTIKLLMAAFENYPPDKELCKKVCVDIFEKNLAEFDKIPHHLRNIVTKMLGSTVESERKDQVSDPEDSSSDIFIGEEPDEENQDVERSHDVAPEFSKASSHSFKECLQFNEDRHNFQREIGLEQETSKSSAECFTSNNNIIEENNSSSNACNSSRLVKERVVRRFVKSVDAFERYQVPANFIAHPSYQPNINSNFQCNISLHNLLPEVYSYYSEISLHDLQQLKFALKNADPEVYVQVLKSYSDPYSIENFIVNVLTLLKSQMSSRESYSTFMSLLENLEKNDECYMIDKFMKVSIEVLALNLIFMLNGKGLYKLSRSILMKLKDWHNLVTSKIFLHSCSSKSHMGRYIYIMNALISADDLAWVNEMFQVKALRLLGPAVTWPYGYKPSDISARNKVIKSFFEKGFSKNIFVVNDLLKYIVFMYGGSVDGYDLSTWFNRKILFMLENQEENRSYLLFLCNDIVNYYQRFMDRYLLQAYMLHMEKYIKSEEALKLFRVCCKKGVYPEFRVEQNLLYIPTNLNNFEIFCVLHCCFETFKEKHTLPHDFQIEIVLPEDEPQEELFIVEEKFRIDRSIYKIFEAICLILQSEYNILIEQPVQSTILISQTMLHGLSDK